MSHKTKVLYSMQVMTAYYYIGVDVGTSSVRAALVDEKGVIVHTAERNIRVHNPRPLFHEQSSNEIWSSCCDVIKEVSNNIKSSHIKGIGFDATCSLVVLDEEFNPVAIDPDGRDEMNIIMWLDHRASEQADYINTTGHKVLDFIGGKISLEMEPPKLLWLKQNMYERCWKKAAHFFDLPDFLTWKATGSLSRSFCSVTCKWTYSPDIGWDESFWRSIGLEDLILNNFSKIGSNVLEIGKPIEQGLSKSCALDTSLDEEMPVGVAMIDAHCGGIGTIGCDIEGLDLNCNLEDFTDRIVLVSGTSSCHMAISNKPIFVPGIWGPYYSAMVPGYWLNEGGQSAVAKLLDHVIISHPAYAELEEISSHSGKHVNTCLNDLLSKLAAKTGSESIERLAHDVHVYPDFHGNRSPLANPTMKGMISGLTLDKGIENLAVLYLATLQALALGTKHIFDSMTSKGHRFKAIFLTGGLQKNALFVQIHANATGLPVILGKETETVLLGAAVLGACASKKQPIQEICKEMCHVGAIIKPGDDLEIYYKKKYEVFLLMQKHQILYKDTLLVTEKCK